MTGVQNEASKHRTDASSFEVLLVCDFDSALSSRILDAYRFFQATPRIVLARRGGSMSVDSRLSVELELVPGRVKGLDATSVAGWMLVVINSVLYVLYAFILGLKLIVHRTKVQIVHAHFIFPQGLFGLLLAFMLRVPLVVTAAGRDVNIIMRRNRLVRELCLLVLRRAVTTIAVSIPLQESLRNFGVKNTIYIPNSVDFDSIPLVDEYANHSSLLYVGSMTRNKDPMTLLHAFELIVRSIPSAQLTMCGDGPLMPLVKDEIAKNKLEDKVKALSFVPPESLCEIRSKTPIFVLPSRSEGLSLALLEAMAAGQLIIVSRIPSHISILKDEETALFFDVDDEVGLSRQLQRAISERLLGHKIESAARQLCRNEFSNSVVARKLESIYLNAIRGCNSYSPLRDESTPRTSVEKSSDLGNAQPVPGCALICSKLCFHSVFDR